MKLALSVLVLSLALVILPAIQAADEKAPSADAFSLITSTPEEGFQLAVKLARKTVKTIQPDVEVLHAQRDAYSKDAGLLIEASQVVAVHFQTIAQANDFWRGK